jgi:PAT family beta-lactamase induction signal transducer AmpG
MFGGKLLESRNGRLSTFGILYISEGIPYGFTSIAMVTFLRQNGIALDQIGLFVATLFIPWTFKFAWAPVIDLIKLNRFGGRKAWIMGSQIMMIITLYMASSVDFISQFNLLLILVLINNIFCATQDVAIDSLAVTTLKPDERARGNGFMFGGQYFGIALGGGAAIYIFGLTNFETALLFITLLQVICLMFTIFFVKDPQITNIKISTSDPKFMKFIQNMTDFTKEVYSSFWQSGRAPKIGFLFSILPVGAMVLGYAALSTIPVDYGFSETKIAQITTANTIAGALGCIMGGILADRFGLLKMLGIFYVLTVIPNLILAFNISSEGLMAVPAPLVAGSLIVHGFLFGMCFSTQAAVFMGITNPAVAATQFTAFMAMGNLAVTYTNYWQGVVAENFDYAKVLYIDSMLVILPLLIIPFLQSREKSMSIKTETES